MVLPVYRPTPEGVVVFLQHVIIIYQLATAAAYRYTHLIRQGERWQKVPMNKRATFSYCVIFAKVNLSLSLSLGLLSIGISAINREKSLFVPNEVIMMKTFGVVKSFQGKFIFGGFLTCDARTCARLCVHV